MSGGALVRERPEKSNPGSRRERCRFCPGFLAGILVVLLAAEAAGFAEALHAGEPGEGNARVPAWRELLQLRGDAAERGVELTGGWRGTFYGLTSGGKDAPHGAFDEELTMGIGLDFGKLAGIEGLTGQAAVRYRDGRSPNTYVGASSTFNPTRYQSGQQWRLMPVFLTYTTPELFGIRHFLTVSAGWQNAYSFFADQPESKLFTNNSIGATKGIGGVNGFPWSSSYAAWGGYAKIEPSPLWYVMGGLYLAIPEATAFANHGLDFAGYGPDPARNGLYFLAESGLRPKFGPEALPGKYAFGAIYWGVENRAFCGSEADQKYTFYWQADQMLFRERKAGEPGSPRDPQGLYAFSFFTFAPPSNNAMPFYFHAGLVYRGLLPGRDSDQAGLAFGHGNYSPDKAAKEISDGIGVHQSYEAVVEADYRFQVCRNVFVQPFWQYIIRPNGSGLVPNANIFGLHMGLVF